VLPDADFFCFNLLPTAGQFAVSFGTANRDCTQLDEIALTLKEYFAPAQRKRGAVRTFVRSRGKFPMAIQAGGPAIRCERAVGGDLLCGLVLLNVHGDSPAFKSIGVCG
jgi:hypothetical protein